MANLQDVLSFHHNRYPLMEFEDVYKLLFQHCYGAKHLNAEKDKILLYLKNESSNIQTEKIEVVDIGNDLFRVSLINNDSYLKELADSFYNTIHKGVNSLDIEIELIANKSYISKTFDIDEQLYDEKIKLLKENGFPAISHSITYKNAYFPHYRVVHREYISALKKYFVENK